MVLNVISVNVKINVKFSAMFNLEMPSSLKQS